MTNQRIVTAALVALGFFFSLDYPSKAQQTQPGTQPNSGTTEQTQPATPSSPASPGATQSNRNQLSAQDRQFLIQAAQGGMAEVRLGKLAQQKAASNSLKKYAQRMIDEHTQVNDQLMQLAASKGVTLPKTVNSQQQALYNQMSKLSGKSFDQAYMKQAGVKSHTQQVSLFQREAKQGKDPDVKAFAAKTLPTIQQHLQAAHDMTGGTTTRAR